MALHYFKHVAESCLKGWNSSSDVSSTFQKELLGPAIEAGCLNLWENWEAYPMD